MIQETLARYLDTGGLDRHLRALRSTFADLIGRHVQAVAEHFPAGTRVEQPSGGFLLWVEAPPGTDTQVLHRRALSIGLGLAPGAMFSASNAFPNAVRINCGVAWGESIKSAYRDYGNLMRSA